MPNAIMTAKTQRKVKSACIHNAASQIPKAQAKRNEQIKALNNSIKVFGGMLKKDNLGKRIFKCTLATACTIIICLLPNIGAVYGKAVYLAPITTVFGHPGRRLGAMCETLVLATIGISIGVAVVCLATYLSNLTHAHNIEAAYGIRGIFITMALLLHGYIRSHTPRLFVMVLLMILPIIIGLTSPLFSLTGASASTYFLPVLTAAIISLLVNVLIFPESGASYLARTTIDSLDQTVKVLTDATDLFVKSSAGHNERKQVEKNQDLNDVANSGLSNKAALRALLDAKTSLREALTLAKAVINECSFELSFSCLPPRDLKAVSSKGLEKLVMNTIALVGACESKYALLGISNDGDENKVDVANSENPSEKIKRTQARREIEFGDEALLKYLLLRVEGPLNTLQATIVKSVDVLKECIELTYHVSKEKDRALAGRHPKGILLQELDIYVTSLDDAISDFDRRSRAALENTSLITEISEHEIDLLPREELFVVSSFLLNLRLAAQRTLEMLQHGRSLVERHRERNGKRRFYLPKIRLQKWLFSGGEENETFNIAIKSAIGRIHQGSKPLQKESEEAVGEKIHRTVDQTSTKDDPTDDDDDSGKSVSLRIREKIADSVDWAVESSNFRYALRLTIGVMLVTWPAFIASFGEWFYLSRGIWVSIIFILVFEDAVGSTIFVFLLRTLGTIAGSAWGYAAWEARNGNSYIVAVMLILGIIPSFYVQLGTKYIKAGMVCTISMSVVAISTHVQTVPGTARENFAKRSIAMLIGGAVAVLVQVAFFPVKARVRLAQSLGMAVLRINEMESSIAFGVDECMERKLDLKNANVSKRFTKSRKKADASLVAAAAYCEEFFSVAVTKNEPRLKGTYESHRLAFTQIIFVLRQIMERMENMLQLRLQHGSAVLENLYSQVFIYRRNVAAAITITLFAVHEALTTKLPLPQFFPSARLAHLRMVNRVREVLLESAKATDLDENKRKVLRLNFLSWNAASAALEEAIEYIEELVDLTKLLVGASEFRSGLLFRPTYREYVKKIREMHEQSTYKLDQLVNHLTDDGFAYGHLSDCVNGDMLRAGLEERHESLDNVIDGDSEEERDDDLPQPLQRIQSRYQGARLARQLSRTSTHSNK